MRTARELAHEFCSGEEFDGQSVCAGGHGADCDRLTAAIEARDGEHAAAVVKAVGWHAALAALRVAREALEFIQEPCGGCDADGPECKDEHHEVADGALTRISELVPL